MKKLAVIIHEAITSLLEDGEEIRTVGRLYSGYHPLLFIGLLSLLVSKSWYVGVTNRRVIFIKLNIWDRPNFKKKYSIPLSDVYLKSNNLFLRTKHADLPQSFKLYFGVKSISGLDKDEFARVLTRRK